MKTSPEKQAENIWEYLAKEKKPLLGAELATRYTVITNSAEQNES